jgi:hypothetical protein
VVILLSFSAFLRFISCQKPGFHGKLIRNNEKKIKEKKRSFIEKS